MPDKLETTYQLRFGGNSSYREQVWKILCSRVFQRYADPSARVLDVGAGWGEFILNIEAGERLAMDLNPALAGQLDGAVKLLQQDCSQPWALEDQSLDLVFSSNFFEHLPTKSALETVIEEAHRTLRVGGKLVCMGPNIRYLPGAYWDFWDHHLPLSDASMVELLRISGFEIERQVPRFLPYSMSTGFQPPLLFLSLYLRLPLAWRLFGKQFFIVAERV
jgi:SAM-dependent methyltransferase